MEVNSIRRTHHSGKTKVFVDSSHLLPLEIDEFADAFGLKKGIYARTAENVLLLMLRDGMEKVREGLMKDFQIAAHDDCL